MGAELAVAGHHTVMRLTPGGARSAKAIIATGCHVVLAGVRRYDGRHGREHTPARQATTAAYPDLCWPPSEVPLMVADGLQVVEQHVAGLNNAVRHVLAVVVIRGHLHGLADVLLGRK